MKWILIIAHFAIAGEPMNAVLDPIIYTTNAECDAAALQLKDALEKSEPGTIYCFAVTIPKSSHIDIGAGI